ncbi:MAG: hypothetical protein ACYTFI_09325, partial [Planctomycetota bacterium]
MGSFGSCAPSLLICLAKSGFTVSDIFIRVLAAVGVVCIGLPGLMIVMGELGAKLRGMKPDYEDPRWSKGCIRIFGAVIVAIAAALWFTCRRDDDSDPTDRASREAEPALPPSPAG